MTIYVLNLIARKPYLSQVWSVMIRMDEMHLLHIRSRETAMELMS